MSKGDCLFLMLMALVIGLAVGAWINNKVEDYRTKVMARKLEEQIALTECYKERARARDAERLDAVRELNNAKKERDKYREFWADELQKRLDLADKLQKYTGGTPTEGAEDANAEDHSGD